MTCCKGYSMYIILVTIFVLVPSSMANRTGRQVDNKSAFPSPSATPFARDKPINVPISMCDSSEQRKYADLTAVHLDPPCDDAPQGFCGLRRNQNYTFIAKFLAKVATKQLSMRVTSIDPNYGWETPIWPEFSVCKGFNITCPQTKNNLVQAFIHEALPQEFPSMRGLIRIRLLGSDAFGIQRVYICRQLNIQVY